MENTNDDVIELNVGGQRMATKRSTLCQIKGSLLASMFGGRWKGNILAYVMATVDGTGR
jgi:hypothetical protein